ncbi:hypothetical protein WMY93_016579 [Mugilogobius chulae]|uniref:Ig-like domain-containing protein n=1 Tax=Mugilogobius chulae TaxID=88201 RepID=A0AAW0NW06_9GOBI
MNSSSAMDFSLRVSPDQSQFFVKDKVSLSCGDTGTGWIKGSTCTFGLLAEDSGQYWCVVLQVPVLPVSPGQTVSLTCRHHTDSAPSVRFYRDGQLLSEQPTGQLTLQQVSVSDEGLYQCEIRGEKSQPSPLRLRADETLVNTTPPPAQSSVSPAQSPVPPAAFSPFLLSIIVGSVLLILLMLLVLIIFLVRRYRDNKDGACPEDHQQRRPIRRSAPFYSTFLTAVKLKSNIFTRRSWVRLPGRPGPFYVESACSPRSDESSLYSTVCYMVTNQTNDGGIRTEPRILGVRDTNTDSGIRVRTNRALPNPPSPQL